MKLALVCDDNSQVGGYLAPTNRTANGTASGFGLRAKADCNKSLQPGLSSTWKMEHLGRLGILQALNGAPILGVPPFV